MAKLLSNKRGMSITTVFVAVFVMGIMSMSLGMLLNDFAMINPDVGINKTELKQFDTTEDLRVKTESIRQQIESNSTSIMDMLGFVPKGAYSAITLTIDSISNVVAIITGAANVFGIPLKTVVAAVTGAITLVIVLLIAGAVFRFQI